jgi:serine/threonine-protein kinase RsbW
MNITVHKKTTFPCFTFKKRMKNNQEMVPDLLNEICLWMTQANASEARITNVQIVLGEALNNIIEHGFEYEGSGLIEIEISVSEKEIVVRLCDNGIAFTPPEASQTPLQNKDDLNGLPEGGFGWFLIKEITSSVKFTRSAGKNHLVLNFL